MSGRTSELLPPTFTTLLRKELPEYANYIAAHPGELVLLRNWRETKADELLRSPEYANLVVPGDEERTPDKMKKKIVKWFSNQQQHPNAAFRKMLAAASTTSSSPLTTNSGQHASTSTTSSRHAGTFGEDLVDHTIQLARRSFLLLVGEYPPRQLFLSSAEGKALIQKRVNELRPTMSNVNGAALWNMAAAQIWNSETFDKSPYENMARDLVANIEKNRETFPGAIESALLDIAQRGLLGDVAMKLCVAFRREDGNVDAYFAHVGYDAVSKAEVDITSDETDAQLQEWMAEANKVLPRHDKPPIDIPTVGGVPCYPSVDLSGSPTNQIELVNKAYLQAVWDYRRLNSTVPEPAKIPLDDIMSDIDTYIDTSIFTVPAPLVPRNPLDVLSLAYFFVNQSQNNNPFLFRATSATPEEPSEQDFEQVIETPAQGAPKTPSPAAQFLLGVLDRAAQASNALAASPPAGTSGTTPPGTTPTGTPAAGPPPISAPSAPPSGALVGTPPTSTPPISTPPISTPPASTPPAGTVPASTVPASTPPAGTPPAGLPPTSTPPTSTPPISTPPADVLPGDGDKPPPTQKSRGRKRKQRDENAGARVTAPRSTRSRAHALAPVNPPNAPPPVAAPVSKRRRVSDRWVYVDANGNPITPLE